MIVRSKCDDCDSEYAIPFIPRCDEDGNGKHLVCDDDCNPTEIRYVPRWHNQGDIYYRCSNCYSLNTEKNG